MTGKRSSQYPSAIRYAAEWREEDHPRNEDGEFVEKDGGVGAALGDAYEGDGGDDSFDFGPDDAYSPGDGEALQLGPDDAYSPGDSYEGDFEAGEPDTSFDFGADEPPKAGGKVAQIVDDVLDDAFGGGESAEEQPRPGDTFTSRATGATYPATTPKQVADLIDRLKAMDAGRRERVATEDDEPELDADALGIDDEDQELDAGPEDDEPIDAEIVPDADKPPVAYPPAGAPGAAAGPAASNQPAAARRRLTLEAVAKIAEKLNTYLKTGKFDEEDLRRLGQSLAERFNPRPAPEDSPAAVVAEHLDKAPGIVGDALRALHASREVQRTGRTDNADLHGDYARRVYRHLQSVAREGDGFGEVYDLSAELGPGAVGYASPAGVLAMLPPRFKGQGWDVRYAAQPPGSEARAPLPQKPDAKGKQPKQPKAPPVVGSTPPKPPAPPKPPKPTPAPKPPKPAPAPKQPKGPKPPPVVGSVPPKPPKPPKAPKPEKAPKEQRTRSEHLLMGKISKLTEDPEEQRAIYDAARELHNMRQNEMSDLLQARNDLLPYSNKIDNAAFIRNLQRIMAKGGDEETLMKTPLGRRWDQLLERAQKDYPHLLGGGKRKLDPSSALMDLLSKPATEFEIPPLHSDESLAEAVSFIQSQANEPEFVPDPALDAVPFALSRATVIRYRRWAMSALGRYRAARAAARKYSKEWKESQHPREDDGKFAEKDSGAHNGGAMNANLPIATPPNDSVNDSRLVAGETIPRGESYDDALAIYNAWQKRNPRPPALYEAKLPEIPKGTPDRARLKAEQEAPYIAAQKEYEANLQAVSRLSGYAEHSLAKHKAEQAARESQSAAKHADKLKALAWAQSHAGKNQYAQQAIDDIRRGDDPLRSVHRAWYPGAAQYAIKQLKKLGAKREHTSEKSASAGSVYYGLPDGRRIRISDHELPLTEERQWNRSQGIRGRWREIVLDRVIPPEEIDAMIDDAVTGGNDDEEFVEKDGAAHNGDAMNLTLYRATDDPIIVGSASFSTSREAAEAYLNNPGFGGSTLYRADVEIDPDTLLDVFDMDTEDAIEAIREVADLPHPGAIGADEWVPRIAETLRDAGIEWVRVRESYPVDSETYIFVGGDDPELEEATDE